MATMTDLHVQGHVTVVVEDEVNSLLLTWDSHKLGPHLLTTVSAVCQALRDERRQPTPEEYLAIQTAYHALGKVSLGRYLAHNFMASVHI